jgi:hypothetical protein
MNFHIPRLEEVEGTMNEVKRGEGRRSAETACLRDPSCIKAVSQTRLDWLAITALRGYITRNLASDDSKKTSLAS